ncbi:MAG: LPS assembly lipoprotein LptE [Desulfonatronovibrionaceae bacterium]
MKQSACFCLLIILTGLAACGYRFEGASAIDLPRGMTRLNITQVINPTQEVWLEPYLRSSLKDEFHRRGGVDWVAADKAQGHVQVEIFQFRTSDSVIGVDETSVKSTLTIVMSVKILSAETSQELWNSGRLTGRDSYFLEAAPSLTPGSVSAGRSPAGQEAVDQAVSRAADRLSSGF